MSKNDIVHRFIFDETDIRGEIVGLEDSFQQAYEHQHFPEALRPLYGEFLAAAALLAQVLKFEGILTLQARGDGDIAMLMAEATDTGNLRGIIKVSDEALNKPDTYFENKSVPELLGQAALAITIDPNKGQRYQGIVPIDSDRLSDCLMHYFEQSEQLPTYIQLFADEKQCGGLFLQCLPAQLITDEKEREQTWETAVHLAGTLSQSEFFELDQQTILYRLFHEMKCRTFEPLKQQFLCSCDKERSANAVRSIGKDEAYALLQERDIIHIDCQFCGKRYAYGDSELEEIFAESNNKPLH